MGGQSAGPSLRRGGERKLQTRASVCAEDQGEFSEKLEVGIMSSVGRR